MHLGAGLLRRNVVASLIGQLLPLIAAISALPAVLSSLGEQRFAILALAWAVVVPRRRGDVP